MDYDKLFFKYRTVCHCIHMLKVAGYDTTFEAYRSLLKDEEEIKKQLDVMRAASKA